MSAIDTMNRYLHALHNGGWENYIADDFSFGNNSLSQTGDREAYLVGAGRFFGFTTSVEIVSLLQEENRVAMVARYATQAPDGRTGVLDVAEFLTVADEKISANAIFFDSDGFRRFITGSD